MSANADILYDQLLSLPEVERAQMFGWVCLRANGYVFLAKSDQGMTFKLDDTTLTELVQEEGIVPFQPTAGRAPMKGWVLITHEHGKHWSSVAEKALAYACSLPPKVKKSKKKS